ncbi:MAG: hypothetical protein ACK4MS_16285 [Paracoccaceae bacterium]
MQARTEQAGAQTTKENTLTDATKKLISRRALLARIGLAAGAAYVAPTLAGLNAARASGASSASAASAASAP